MQAAIPHEPAPEEDCEIVPVALREANPEDLRRLLSIEKASFPKGDHTPNGSVWLSWVLKSLLCFGRLQHTVEIPAMARHNTPCALQLHEDVHTESAQRGIQGNDRAGG